MKNWTNKARVYTVKKKRDNNSTTQIYIYIYIHTHTQTYVSHFRLAVIQKYFSFHKTDTNFEHEYAIVYHVFSCLTSGAFSMYSFF